MKKLRKLNRQQKLVKLHQQPRKLELTRRSTPKWQKGLSWTKKQNQDPQLILLGAWLSMPTITNGSRDI